jgi:hypothetical protein
MKLPIWIKVKNLRKVHNSIEIQFKIRWWYHWILWIKALFIVIKEVIQERKKNEPIQ